MLFVTSCALGKQLVAPTDDLADYRAYRAAAAEGTRLARAQSYLAKHPRGSWSEEVRVSFESEEQAYFEACSMTRDRTREYLVDLPQGPHAAAALALLTAFDQRIEDEATARMLREARRTEASLEMANEARRRVGETVLAWLAALLETNVYTARIEDAPPALRRALAANGAATWGGVPAARSVDLFFTLPSRPERESRLLTLTLSLAMRNDRVIGGTIEAPDMFVRWTEADMMRSLDSTLEADRALAARHVTELLEGALEARFPAKRCDARDPKDPTLLARACDDWMATARMAEPGMGRGDSITIRHDARSRGESGPAAVK